MTHTVHVRIMYTAKKDRLTLVNFSKEAACMSKISSRAHSNVYSHVQAANEILTDTYEKMANNQLMFCSVYVCTCTYTFTFSPSLLRCVHVHIHNRKSVSNTDLHIRIQSFLHTVSQGMDTAIRTCR